MNRNTEMHFGHIPSVDLKRSKFDMSHSLKTSFNTGDIIPIYCDMDILPGDTVQVDLASLVRMATPIYPIMDNLYLDTYWFFTPHRLVFDQWQEFWGENEDPWARTTEIELPMLEQPDGGWQTGTIGDYIGIPIKVKGEDVNALGFRSYVKIWNDWFRDQNLKQAAHMYKDDVTRLGKNDGDYVLNAEFGGKPLKAAKLHDFFTSALPSPQKGPSVTIPMLGMADVVTGVSRDTNLGKGSFFVSGKVSGTNISSGTLHNISISTLNNKGALQVSAQGEPAGQDVRTIQFDNLYADLSSATTATISQLRMAFAVQRYYENAARAGSRYIEYIRSVFGVTSSDARMQRSEYLGGKRIPLNIDQVLQTSSTDQTSPQGNTAGFSCTFDKHSAFTKSFEEHGTLMCLAVVRTEHTYQQGIHKQFLRKQWHQFYNPFFANLSEQGIENQQLYAQQKGTPANTEMFGYQEAWAEYRFRENRTSGYMRSQADGSLDVWHLGDDYQELPTLGSEWIDEPTTNVDRVIAVTSQLNHQFIGDFYFKMYYTRPMPVYSVPGLIDHV